MDLKAVLIGCIVSVPMIVASMREVQSTAIPELMSRQHLHNRARLALER